MSVPRSIHWAAMQVDGRAITGEFEGTITGEPEVRLWATPHAWGVELCGVEAKGGHIGQHDVSRATRKNSKIHKAQDIAKARAESWALKVLALRDSGDYTPKARTPGDEVRAPDEGEAGQSVDQKAVPPAADGVPESSDGSRDSTHLLGLSYLGNADLTACMVSCGTCAEKEGITWKYDSTESDLRSDVCAFCGQVWTDPWAT